MEEKPPHISRTRNYRRIRSEGKIRQGQSSRVGRAYQATIPPRDQDNSTKRFHPISSTIPPRDEMSITKKRVMNSFTSNYDSIEGRPVWIAGVIPEAHVNAYLEFVKRLFPSKMFYCEERALFLLHKLNYDVQAVVSMLEMELESIKGPFQQHTTLDDIEPDDDYCFICNDGGKLLCCDADNCSKVYHLKCAKLDSMPSGAWYCPWHFCVLCAKAAESKFKCVLCPTSYCMKHVPSDIVGVGNAKFLCSRCSALHDSSERSFVLRLGDFLKDQGTPMVRIPKINRTELDLCALYQQVTKRGGLSVVEKRSDWKGVVKAMGFPSSFPRIQKILRSHYIRFLYAYEQSDFPGSTPFDFKNLKKLENHNESSDSASSVVESEEEEEYPIVNTKRARVSRDRFNLDSTAILAQQVQSILEETGVSIQNLASHLHISESLLSQFLNGKINSKHTPSVQDQLKDWAVSIMKEK